MGKTRNRILGLAAVLATATACSDTSEEVVTLPDGAAIQNDVVDLQSRSNASTVEVEYVASYDPATGVLDMEVLNTFIDTPLLSMENGEVLRQSEQGLFCQIRNTNGGGASGTIGLSTTNIFEDAASCGYPNVFPYNTLGVFCADITAASNLAVDIEDLYAEITEVTPTEGHNGYAFPNGTGANPAGIPASLTAPANTLGLWSYGDVPASTNVTEKWVFEYDLEPFTFRGRMIGIVPEICGNGFDDNCDGVLDNQEGNGANCGVEAVDTCLDDSDCETSNCDAGTCGPALPEDCAAAGDEDGNGLEGCADAACAGLLDDTGALCPTCGIVIDGLGTYTGNTLGAGDDTDVVGTDGEDIAFFFTPDTTGDYSFSTCGSDYDTTLQVFDGDCAAAGTSLGSNFSSFATCGTGGRAALQGIALTAGVEVMIVVDGDFGATGNVELIISSDDPEVSYGAGACADGIDNNNDGVVDCDEVDCFGVDGCAFPFGTCEAPSPALIGANPISAEDVNSVHTSAGNNGCFSAIGNSDEFVFQYTATNTGTVTFDTTGSDYDTVLYVRHAAGLADLATCADNGLQIACNDDGLPGALSTLDVDVVAGETYFVFLDAYFPVDLTDVAVLNISADEGFTGLCSDGLDNDGNGDIDCADATCLADPACITAALPYTENFNADDGGWTVEVLSGNDAPWQYGTPSTVFDGDAWQTGLLTAYNNNANAVLRSPTVDISGVTSGVLSVSFQLSYGTEATYDGATLWAVIDGVETVVDGGINNWYNSVRTGFGTDFWSGSSGGFVLAEAEIAVPPAASTAYLELRFVSDGSSSFAGVILDDVSLTEQPIEDCLNGVDDNGNGDIDCAEASCLIGEPACTETGAECVGGVDDDGDGDIDCADSDCALDEACTETGAECVGGVDDDGDGDIDCADSDCVLDPACLAALPYFEDFEGANDWEVTSGTDWVIGTPAGGTINAAFDGVSSVNFTSYSSNAVSAIESPPMDTSGLATDAVVAFRYHSNLEGSGSFAYDNVRVRYSIDGAPYALVTDGIAAWNPVSFGGVGAFGADTGGYVFASATLTGTAGSSTVQLEFTFDSDGSGLDEGFSFDAVTVRAPSPDLCLGGDEDVDGLVDCADSDCYGAGCTEVCTGGDDENGDGDIDCADVACAGIDPVCDESCTGGVDEDLDGDIDCADSECAGIDPVCFESCTGGVDEDLDGDIDCADSECAGIDPACDEVCTSGVDEDLDGDIDCADTDCAADVACIVVNTFPYNVSFEGTDADWIATGSWERGAPAAPYDVVPDGTEAFATNLTGLYGASAWDTLTSPLLDFSDPGLTADPVFSFTMAFQSENSWDGANVQYSTDGGVTWTIATNFATGAYNITDNNCPNTSGGIATVDCWMGEGDDSYNSYAVVLDGADDSANVRVRFVLASDGSGQRDGFYVDDFTIGVPAPEMCMGGDDDLDGLVDCDDSDCFGVGCTEVCDSGLDENANGDIDCDDAECAVDPLCTTVDTYPYAISFEGEDGGWVGTGSWERGAPDAPFDVVPDGTEAWATNLTGDYGANAWETLTSPPFDLSDAALTADPVFSFSMAFQSENSWDGLNVQYSTDDGATWTIATTFLTGAYNINDNRCPLVTTGAVGTVDCWMGEADTSYNNYAVVLDGADDSVSARIRFVFASDSGGNREGFYVDDFSVAIPAPELCLGGDDDLDGLVDCLDDDCYGPGCTEVCDSGFDEDNDGAVDCVDLDCANIDPACTELCFGGVDEDLDGDIDCLDGDCGGDSSCITSISTFPYSTDFSAGTEGWTPSGEWEFGVATTTDFAAALADTLDAYTGTGQGWWTDLDNTYNTSANNPLESVTFDMSALTPGDDPVVTITYISETEGLPFDSNEFDYSIDGGTTWTTLDVYEDDIDADDQVILSTTYALAGAAGQADVRFRITSISDTSANFEGFGLLGFVVEVPDPEDTAAFCVDGLDNDIDGDIDCADSECWSETTCPEVCGSTFDEDQDTFIDCLDSDCWGPSCSEICDSGNDEDGDTLVDCLDSDCDFDPACASITPGYSTSWEAGADGWTSVGSDAFELGTPAQTTLSAAADGVNAWMTDLDANYEASQGEYVLESPVFDLSGENDAIITFSMIAVIEDSFEDIGVFYSVDGGTSWISAGGSALVLPWAPQDDTAGAARCSSHGNSFSGEMFHCWDVDIAAWTVYSTVLDGTAGLSDVRVRIEMNGDGSGNQEGVAIDLFSLTAAGAAELCTGGGDEDLDGQTDCADANCATVPACIEAGATCTDGIDNDLDGDLDCADSACVAEAACIEEGAECVDGLDNDGDGDIDCADSQCATDAACLEEGAECVDGLDNDGDGDIDCADSDCAAEPTCLEVGAACSDGIDNDIDGNIDCFDSDCAADAACLEQGAECTDGLDNDGDGNVDCFDSDCAAEAACIEDGATCSDGLDNDVDGDTDCDDADCIGVGACPGLSNLISFEFVTTGSFPAEKEYEVFTSAGVSQFARVSGPSDTLDVILLDGCYYIEVRDTYGDSWDGYTMDVTDATPATLLSGIQSQNLNGVNNDSVLGGEWQNIAFGVNAVGCTAPAGGP